MSKEEIHTFLADEAEPAVLHIDNPILYEVEKSKDLKGLSRRFEEEAERICDFFGRHLPQGLVDHIFARLAHKLASQYIVADQDLPWNKMKD